MQTFVPSTDLVECARVLDNRRLNKQITEAFQIVLELCGERAGWQHHPAVRMWRGHETFLLTYGRHCYEEWQRRWRTQERGGVRTHRAGEEILRRLRRRRHPPVPPPWWGRADVHASHRAVLLAKNHDWYRRFGWSESPTGPDAKGRWPYVWPLDE